MIDLSKEEIHAIQEFLRRCTVPLVYEDEKQNLGLAGTGSFFRYAQNLWIITAAHIFNELSEDERATLGVPIAETRQYLTLGSYEILKPKDATFDVAVIRIEDSDLIELAERNWTILTERNIAPLTREMNRFVVAGYPLEVVREKRAITPDSFTQFYAERYTGHPEPSDTHPMLYLAYAREAPTISGEIKKTPNLKGLSGGNVWAIMNEKPAVWAPENVLKAVAVQVSFKHDSYIRCEPWAVVLRVFQLWSDQQKALRAQIT